jgi:hypothetical protein
MVNRLSNQKELFGYFFGNAQKESHATINTKGGIANG